MPMPRFVPSMIAPMFRVAFAWPYRFGLSALYRAGLAAWHVTLLSLIANAVAGWLLLTGRFFVSGMLILVAGILDIMDGGLARMRGTAGPAGAFLDSVMDRISDVIVLGSLFWALADQGHRVAAALALSGLVVSLLTSQVRAEAEAVGLQLTEGVVQRLERYLLLVIGLTAPGALLPVLAVLTVLGTLTVVQRVDSAWRQLGSGSGSSRAPRSGVRRARA